MFNTVSIVALVVLFFLVLAMAIRFLYWQIDQELKDLAELENDPLLRKERLIELDSLLADKSTSPKLFKKRADIHRFDNNHAAVIRDLQAYLEHFPKDDAGWAELSEACIEEAKFPEAVEAIEQAIQRDPSYQTWYELKARALVNLADPRSLINTIDRWAEIVRGDEQAFVKPDPRLLLYRSVAAVLEKDSDRAKALLKQARVSDSGVVDDIIRADSALRAAVESIDML